MMLLNIQHCTVHVGMCNTLQVLSAYHSLQLQDMDSVIIVLPQKEAGPQDLDSFRRHHPTDLWTMLVCQLMLFELLQCSGDCNIDQRLFS